MKILVLISLLAVCSYATVTLTNVPFTIDHSVNDDTINFVIEGTNEYKGSVAFGIGGTGMAGMDIAVFSIGANSKITVVDRTNIGANLNLVASDTEKGGKNDWSVVDADSSYTAGTGAWKISVNRKLKTGDIAGMDNDLEVGKDVQVAIAIFDDTTFVWGTQTGENGKHKKQDKGTINVGSNSLLLKVSLCLVAGLFFLF